MNRDVRRLLRDERANALAAWAIVVVVAAVVVASLVDGNFLWAAFSATLVVLAVLPPVLLRHRNAMLPWEILLLAALPVVGRVFATVQMTGNLARYLSVAAVALIIAVELHVFTPVRMTPRFAVAFVVVTTMATAGIWAVARWGADLLLGTTFLLDPARTEHAIEEALMWEFVASTVAGVGAGLVFGIYVSRQVGVSRVPDGVRIDQ